MADDNRRHRQIAHAIRDEIVSIIRKDLSDPRLEMAGMITVSGVDLAPDMKSASVWVSFMGRKETEAEVKGAIEALNHSQAYIHRLLIKRIPMKKHPIPHFRFDPMFDRAEKVSSAFKEAAAIEAETAQVRSSKPEENQ
jgi:ribosome-binding factor A